MRDLCDVVYVLLLEALERHIFAAQQMAAVFKAAGAEHVDIPLFDQERVSFDEQLTAAPESGGMAGLLREIGVA